MTRSLKASAERLASAAAGVTAALLTTFLLAATMLSSARTEEAAPRVEGPGAGRAVGKKADKALPAKPKPTVDAPRQTVAPPSPDLIVVLVRTTLLALNDALRADNFTVLRDLASSRFRAVHTPGKLSQIFSDLAGRGIDLSAVAVLSPELSERPFLDASGGVLRLKGVFDGKPVRIDFDLLFQAEGGRWKLLGLSVQPVTNAVQPVPAAKAVPKLTPAQP